jgi:hypothetical protein
MRALDQYWPVRANGSARGAAMPPLPLRPLGLRDRVRARNDRDSRDLPRFVFTETTTMTAYLISLALAGLIALAVCDALL